MTGDPRPTAAVIVIGDELLGGKVEERNVRFFIERFRELGVRLVHVEIVGDEVGVIAEAIRRACGGADHVCTAGGVGPTHDDVTMAAVAEAFDVPLVTSETLLEIVAAHSAAADIPLGEGHRRLAAVPAGSELVGSRHAPWPTVRKGNVLVFPGVPKLLRAKFYAIQEIFGGAARYAGDLLYAAVETSICEALDSVVARNPNVDIGSYPRFERCGPRLRLTVDAATLGPAEAAFEDLRASLPLEPLEVNPPRRDRALAAGEAADGPEPRAERRPHVTPLEEEEEV